MRWGGVGCLTVLLIAGPAPAQELETDAASAARGGLWVLGRLEDSPGARARDRRTLQVDAWLPWVGAGMAAAAARVEWGGDRGVASLRVAQLRTPVGSLTSFGAAGGLAWHAWQAGLALECRSLDLGGEAALIVPVLRVGGGAWVGSSLEARAAMEIAPPRRAAGRAALGCEVHLSEALRAVAQIEQTLGNATAVRIGFECGSGEVRILAGFDPNLRALSVGVGWRDGHRGVVWGARSHPQLGWSHWCTCTFGSRSPAG